MESRITNDGKNKPRYIVVDFEEYEAIKGIREARKKVRNDSRHFD